MKKRLVALIMVLATEDYTFETLNYFLDSYDLLDNDSAADIDNYLLVSE